MIGARWKNNTLEVTVIKGSPGYLVIEGKTPAERLMFPSDGFGTVVLKAKSKPTAVWWMASGTATVAAKAAPPKGKKLPSGEHRTKPKEYANVPDSEFAGEGYTFPVNSASRVHSALAYFSKHPWPTAAQKKKAAKKILAASRKFNITVDKNDDVWKAAHGK